MKLPIPKVRKSPTGVGWATFIFAAISAAAVAVAATTDRYDQWATNIATEAAAIVVVIAVVDRLVAREQRETARSRVKQALDRISGDLNVLADFVLWDHATLHRQTPYERPPAGSLHGVLHHWSAALKDATAPWPKDPSFLVATKSLSERLAQQLQRHERVLEHDFVAAAYRYMRSERMMRNTYFEEGSTHRSEDEWRRSALKLATRSVLIFLDDFEPYARRYLGHDWAVTVTDEEIDFAERVGEEEAELIEDASERHST